MTRVKVIEKKQTEIRKKNQIKQHIILYSKLLVMFHIICYCIFVCFLFYFVYFIHCLKIARTLCLSFNMFSLSSEQKQRSTQKEEKSSVFVDGSCESVFIRKFSISISFHFVVDHEYGTKYFPDKKIQSFNRQFHTISMHSFRCYS